MPEPRQTSSTTADLLSRAGRLPLYYSAESRRRPARIPETASWPIFSSRWVKIRGMPSDRNSWSASQANRYHMSATKLVMQSLSWEDNIRTVVYSAHRPRSTEMRLTAHSQMRIGPNSWPSCSRPVSQTTQECGRVLSRSLQPLLESLKSNMRARSRQRFRKDSKTKASRSVPWPGPYRFEQFRNLQLLQVKLAALEAYASLFHSITKNARQNISIFCQKSSTSFPLSRTLETLNTCRRPLSL